MHLSRRPHIEASRWVLGDEQRGIIVELAAEHELLLISPRERSYGRVGNSGAHVVLFDDPFGAGAERRPVHAPAARARRPERDVFGRRKVEDERIAMAVLGNE